VPRRCARRGDTARQAAGPLRRQHGLPRAAGGSDARPARRARRGRSVLRRLQGADGRQRDRRTAPGPRARDRDRPAPRAAGGERAASMEWPRLETADSISALVSGTPLEWSARQAFREPLEWVVEDYDLPRPKAALLLAMVANAGICQISNTDYTAYCTAPRGVLAPYLRA